MLLGVPPVTIIRIPVECGSFGYGAKLDGDIICIPMNPAVFKAIEASGVKIPRMTVAAMPRRDFNELPTYGGDEHDRD